MDPIPESGYYYTNRFALATLRALEEVMGRNGLNAILNMANLSYLIGNYPENNLEKAFDFSHFSMIVIALEEMYGPRGGRALALRAGRATALAMRAGRANFSDASREYGVLAGFGDFASKVLPLQTKLRIGLFAIPKIFSKMSDQKNIVYETDNEYLYTIQRCPFCWERSGEEKPVCFVFKGILQEGLKWVSGGREFRVEETKCIATGDEVCEFTIQKKPIR